jgi:hypothetical protein
VVGAPTIDRVTASSADLSPDLAPAPAPSGWPQLRASLRGVWDSTWEPVGATRVALTAAMVALGSVVYVLRRPTALSEPQLLAEDGPILLLQTLQRGWRSFNDAYAGYLIVIPRLLAWLVSPLPIRLTPVLYAWAATLFAAAVASIVLSARIAWLLPSYTRRIVLFAGLLMLPQMPEVHATLVNTVWWCGIGLVLLGLCDDPVTAWGKAVEAGVTVLLVLSGAAAIVTAPIALHRLWRTRSRWSLVFTGTWGACAVAQLVILRSQDRAVGDVTGPAAQLIGVSLKRVIGPFAVSQAYVADHLVADRYRPAAWLAVVFVSVLFVVVTAVGLPRATGPVVLLLVVLSMVGGVLAMGPLARYLPDRYATVPTALVALVAVAAAPRHRWVQWMRVVMVAWLLVVWPMNVAVPRRQPHDWTEAGRCLSRGDIPCRVPVLPEDRTFDVPPGGPRPG